VVEDDADSAAEVEDRERVTLVEGENVMRLLFEGSSMKRVFGSLLWTCGVEPARGETEPRTKQADEHETLFGHVDDTEQAKVLNKSVVEGERCAALVGGCCDA
jgi:hypothetical protein